MLLPRVTAGSVKDHLALNSLARCSTTATSCPPTRPSSLDKGFAGHDAETGTHLLCPDLVDKPARLNHYRQWIEPIIGSLKANSPSKRTAGASSPGSTPASPPGSLPRHERPYLWVPPIDSLVQDRRVRCRR